MVLFIHGGGFRGGDKHSVNWPLLQKLLGHGVSFASLNYRLSNSAPFPAQMHDCAHALQFIRLHAEEYNINPNRIGAMGGSAGAGISEWLAFHDDLADPDNPDPLLRQSTRLSAIAPFNAQTSYDPRFIQKLFASHEVHPALIAFYGMESEEDINNPKFFPLFEEASPINHFTANDPPIFFYYSHANTPLSEENTAAQRIHHPLFGLTLKKKADALGVECTVRLHEESPRFPVDEIADFFLQHLKDSAPRPNDLPSS